MHRSHLRVALLSPALVLLVVAPFVAEVLSTSTSLLAYVPYLPFEAALYGGGALLIREAVRRRGLGAPGMLVLGAAFGVLNEALCVRSWFAPGFLDDPGASAYSRVWGTNLLEAVHLTAFHAVVSVWAPIAIVELLFPDRRAAPWAGRRGLVAAVLGLVAVLGVSVVSDAFYAIPVPQFLAAAALAVALVLVGLRLRPLRPLPTPSGAPRRLAPKLGLAVAAHFALVWWLQSSRVVPWPVGVLAALVPVAAGLRVARRPGSLEPAPRLLAAVGGVLAPLVVLDVVLGAYGRVDLLASAVLAVLGFVGLRRGVRSAPPLLAGPEPAV